MIPVVTPAEMGEIDAAAPEPVEELIERAGAAVARAAVAMLGGTYGRRVVVIAGKGNNGNDGRAAARRLVRRGRRRAGRRGGRGPGPASTAPIWSSTPPTAPGSAAPGRAGRRRRRGAGGRHPERSRRADGRGRRRRAPRRPHRHVRGAEAGPAAPAGIGLPGRGRGGRHRARCQPRPCPSGDRGGRRAAGWLPRAADTHKWHAAVAVVAGSPGMSGAARLVTAAAMRTGAGYVRLSTPGGQHDPGVPTEAVTRSLPPASWAAHGDEGPRPVQGAGRRAGPGPQRRHHRRGPRAGGRAAQVPVVVDGDGLFALAWSADGAASLLRDRPGPTVLTPHDGEFGLLAGRKPGADRLAAARAAGRGDGAVVLLKGPATVVAEPGRRRPALDRRRRAAGHGRDRGRAVRDRRRPARAAGPGVQGRRGRRLAARARRGAAARPGGSSRRTCPGCCRASWSPCDGAAGRSPAPGLGGGGPGRHRRQRGRAGRDGGPGGALGGGQGRRLRPRRGSRGPCRARSRRRRPVRGPRPGGRGPAPGRHPGPGARAVRAARGPARRARPLAPHGDRVLARPPGGAGPRGPGGRGRDGAGPPQGRHRHAPGGRPDGRARAPRPGAAGPAGAAVGGLVDAPGPGRRDEGVDHRHPARPARRRHRRAAGRRLPAAARPRGQLGRRAGVGTGGPPRPGAGRHRRLRHPARAPRWRPSAPSCSRRCRCGPASATCSGCPRGRASRTATALVLEREATIATLPLGYADGVPRRLGDRRRRGAARRSAAADRGRPSPWTSSWSTAATTSSRRATRRC